VGQSLFHYHNDRVDREEHPEARFEVDVEIDLWREEVDLDALEYQIRKGEATPEEAMKYLDLAIGQEGRTAEAEAKNIVAKEIFGEDWEPDS
jgi:hypothetical protein